MSLGMQFLRRIGGVGRISGGICSPSCVSSAISLDCGVSRGWKQEVPCLSANTSNFSRILTYSLDYHNFFSTNARQKTPSKHSKTDPATPIQTATSVPQTRPIGNGDIPRFNHNYNEKVIPVSPHVLTEFLICSLRSCT